MICGRSTSTYGAASFGVPATSRYTHASMRGVINTRSACTSGVGNSTFLMRTVVPAGKIACTAPGFTEVLSGFSSRRTCSGGTAVSMCLVASPNSGVTYIDCLR